MFRARAPTINPGDPLAKSSNAALSAHSIACRATTKNSQMSAHCNALQQTATHCNTLQHNPAHCNILQHAATRCNTLRHAATHCNTQHHTHTASTITNLTKQHRYHSIMQHTATHCNTLQTLVVVDAEPPQHTTTHSHCNNLQHPATPCNTLQHTATHRNTLQHLVAVDTVPPLFLKGRADGRQIVCQIQLLVEDTVLSVFRCFAVCCSVLQYGAVRYSVLHCVAVTADCLSSPSSC